MFAYFWRKIKSFFIINPRWSKFSVVVLVLLVGIGIFGFISPASADLGGWMADGVSSILLGLASFIGKLLVLVIGVLLEIVSYNDFVNSKAVETGWIVLRDLCNLFFILILLVIAFGSILRLENYKYNKLLGKLVIMIVLVNFSKMIAGFFIDISQVVLLTFSNAFSGAAAANFTKALKLKDMLGITGKNAQSGGISSWELMSLSLLPVILLTVALFTMLAMVVVFMVRIIMLWILVMLSPLAYLLAILPTTQEYSKKWWTNFIKWVTTGPILAFFIWFGLTLISNGNLVDINNKGDQIVNTGGTVLAANISKISDSQSLLSFAMAIGMFVASLVVAQSLGGIAGGMAGKTFNKLKGAGSSILKSPGKLAGKVGGGALNMVSRSKGVQNMLGSVGGAHMGMNRSIGQNAAGFAAKFTGVRALATKASIGMKDREADQKEKSDKYVANIKDNKILARFAKKKGTIGDAARRRMPSAAGSSKETREVLDKMESTDYNKFTEAQHAANAKALGPHEMSKKYQEYLETNKRARLAFNEGMVDAGHAVKGVATVKGKKSDGREYQESDFTDTIDPATGAVIKTKLEKMQELEFGGPAHTGADLARILRKSYTDPATRKTTNFSNQYSVDRSGKPVDSSNKGAGNISANKFTSDRGDAFAIDYEKLAPEYQKRLKHNMGTDDLGKGRGMNIHGQDKVELAAAMEPMVKELEDKVNGTTNKDEKLKASNDLKKLKGIQTRLRDENDTGDVQAINSSGYDFKSIKAVQDTFIHEEAHGAGLEDEQKTRDLTTALLGTKFTSKDAVSYAAQKVQSGERISDVIQKMDQDRDAGRESWSEDNIEGVDSKNESKSVSEVSKKIKDKEVDKSLGTTGEIEDIRKGSGEYFGKVKAAISQEFNKDIGNASDDEIKQAYHTVYEQAPDDDKLKVDERVQQWAKADFEEHGKTDEVKKEGEGPDAKYSYIKNEQQSLQQGEAFRQIDKKGLTANATKPIYKDGDIITIAGDDGRDISTTVSSVNQNKETGGNSYDVSYVDDKTNEIVNKTVQEKELQKKNLETGENNDENNFDEPGANRGSGSLVGKAKDAFKKADKKKLSKELSKQGLGTAATIWGVKSLYTVPAYIRQKMQASKTKKGISSSVMQGKFDDGLAQIEKANISDDQKENLKQQLLKIQSNYKEGEDGIDEKAGKEIQEALDQNVTTKISGIEASREALNTALTYSGLGAARGGMYLGMSVLERFKKARAKSKLTGEKADWKYHANDFGNAFKETWSDLRGKGEGGKLAKGIKRISAAGKVTRAFGIGASAFGVDIGISSLLDKFDDHLDGVQGVQMPQSEVQEHMQTLAGSFLPEEITEAVDPIMTVHKGDNVWNMLKSQLKARLNEKYEELSEMQKTTLIDQYKDQVVANPAVFGLDDPNVIQPGQKINFESLFEDDSQLDQAVESTDNINPKILMGEASEAVAATSDSSTSSPALSTSILGEKYWQEFDKNRESRLSDAMSTLVKDNDFKNKEELSNYLEKTIDGMKAVKSNLHSEIDNLSQQDQTPQVIQKLQGLKQYQESMEHFIDDQQFQLDRVSEIDNIEALKTEIPKIAEESESTINPNLVKAMYADKVIMDKQLDLGKNLTDVEKQAVYDDPDFENKVNDWEAAQEQKIGIQKENIAQKAKDLVNSSKENAQAAVENIENAKVGTAQQAEELVKKSNDKTQAMVDKIEKMKEGIEKNEAANQKVVSNVLKDGEKNVNNKLDKVNEKIEKLMQQETTTETNKQIEQLDELKDRLGKQAESYSHQAKSFEEAVITSEYPKNVEVNITPEANKFMEENNIKFKNGKLVEASGGTISFNSNPSSSDKGITDSIKLDKVGNGNLRGVIADTDGSKDIFEITPSGKVISIQGVDDIDGTELSPGSTSNFSKMTIPDSDSSNVLNSEMGKYVRDNIKLHNEYIDELNEYRQANSSDQKFNQFEKQVKDLLKRQRGFINKLNSELESGNNKNLNLGKVQPEKWAEDDIKRIAEKFGFDKK